MSAFSDQALTPCTPKSTALTHAEVSELMGELEDWQLLNHKGIVQITRRYPFKNFVTAMAFAEKVADIAEQENHHPRLCIEWAKLEIYWWTHSISGLFINDFIMAARCDELYAAEDSA